MLFGPAGRALYGVFHAATQGTSRLAVLIAHPVPDQYMRLRWAHQQLAEMLAREGHPVLRFDWWGTGDSGGNLESATLSTWIGDVALAVAELKEAAGVASIAAVGLGVSGSVVALATARGLAVDHLLLVDPVVRGARPSKAPGLALNSEIDAPAAMRKELASIDLCSELPRCKDALLILDTAPDEGSAGALAERLIATGQRVRLRRVPEASDPFPGQLDEAMLSNALPEAVVRLLSERNR